MPYYALINQRDSTMGLESVEEVKKFVSMGLKNRHWPQGDSGSDGTWDMVEVYDMEIKPNGRRDLVTKYFHKDGKIQEAGKSSSLSHTHAKDDIFKMLGLSNVHDRMQDPDKLFVDITMIIDPTTLSDDGSFAMNFEKNYLDDNGSEDAEEKTISRIMDHRMFDIIIDVVSKDFVNNHLDGKNVLKIEYGVKGATFMDEDTYIQGWIYNQQGKLIEQHGYPRKGF
jgi:hypothetical protein